MNRALFLGIAAWFGIAAPIAALGETLYVIDRLLVGVHEDTARDSAIVKVVPTATMLEILKREKDFVKVRTPDGSEGWVDASYLTEEVPSQLVVEELEAWKKTRKEELDAAWAEVETLRAKISKKKGDPPNLDKVNSTLKDLQRLQGENRKLKEAIAGKDAQLGALSQKLHEPPASRTTAPTVVEPTPLQTTAADNASPDAPLLDTWQWIVFGVLFALGLGLGVYLMDVIQRMRHGGFRV